MQCESIHCSISEQRGRFIRLANSRSPLQPPSTKVRTLNKRELSWHIHSSRRITILMVFFHTAELVEGIENWGCFYSQCAQRQRCYEGSILYLTAKFGSQSTPSFTSLVLNNSLVNCCYKKKFDSVKKTIIFYGACYILHTEEDTQGFRRGFDLQNCQMIS